jgi:hypothetical protein
VIDTVKVKVELEEADQPMRVTVSRMKANTPKEYYQMLERNHYELPAKKYWTRYWTWDWSHGVVKLFLKSEVVPHYLEWCDSKNGINPVPEALTPNLLKYLLEHDEAKMVSIVFLRTPTSSTGTRPPSSAPKSLLTSSRKCRRRCWPTSKASTVRRKSSPT